MARLCPDCYYPVNECVCLDDEDEAAPAEGEPDAE